MWDVNDRYGVGISCGTMGWDVLWNLQVYKILDAIWDMGWDPMWNMRWDTDHAMSGWDAMWEVGWDCLIDHEVLCSCGTNIHRLSPYSSNQWDDHVRDRDRNSDSNLLSRGILYSKTISLSKSHHYNSKTNLL